MSLDAWDMLKSVVDWLVIPAVGGLSFFMRRHVKKVEDIEKRITFAEVRVAVIESKIDDIRDDIKEIKEGVTKLVDRR